MIALSVSAIFSGCMEDYLKPLAKCTDKIVVEKTTKLIDEKSPFNSKVQLNEETIMLVGINEKTKVKTCKVKVDYVLNNENNNSMLSMMNEIPFVSDLSKNIVLTYTITPTEDKKDFIITIID